MIFILVFVENAIRDFSVLLRTGSKPADINQFRSQTGKKNFSFSLSCWRLKKQIINLTEQRSLGKELPLDK